MPRLSLLLCFALLPVVHADNWTHWRGPDATGASSTATPPLTWDAKTNIAWQAPIPGRGSSTPIVLGDQVFVLTALNTGIMAEAKDLPAPSDAKYQKRTLAPKTFHEFLVLSFDRATGKERWRATATKRVPHEGHHDSHSYAAGSPTTDGKRLYVSFGSFGVFAYDLTGKQLWSRDLGRQETRLGWGEASTPVVVGDRLYLAWDHEAGSFVTALDSATGKTLWKTERDEPSHWATPLVVEHKGKTQVILPGVNKVRSYDGSDGKLLWEYEGLTINCIPSPIRDGDHVIVMSGYRGQKGAKISLDAKGEVTPANVAWKLDKGTPYVPSAALANGKLWFTATNMNLLSCVDSKSGKVMLDRVRVPGVRDFYASPLIAAGRVYLTDREGTTVVLKESADKVEVLATNKLGEPIDASPVMVGKELFLRGEKHLWCVKETAKPKE
jgi:outer membrane protein assembly factor BamB